jgi:YD repeat-containing protein
LSNVPAYEYDTGGLRTKLAMPGNLEIEYEYDTRGQLVSMTDWDGGRTRRRYDRVGRHVTTERPNRLRTRYGYDAASRLRLLRHTAGSRTLAHFAYEVDGRGNRTQHSLSARRASAFDCSNYIVQFRG